MPASSTNSKDIIANSVSIIDANDTLNTMDSIGSINRVIASIVGDQPQTLNTIQKLAAAINNDPQVHNTIVAMPNSKFPFQRYSELLHKTRGSAYVPQLGRQCP